MWRGNCPTAILFLLALTIVLAQYEYPMGTNDGDLKALVERFKSLPELRGSSVVAASPDLLVLIPTPGQSLAQIRAALLQQPEVYELEVRDETHRREGNEKPYEVLRKERLAQ
ncbi:hypothetical protein VOLCADRAFT_118930, partial [Volvox carteri f. nagariensis]